jgi:hypothetical protein
LGLPTDRRSHRGSIHGAPQTLDTPLGSCSRTYPGTQAAPGIHLASASATRSPRSHPFPVLSAPATPRAQLVHIRAIGNYENVWRVLKERLDEPAARLKSQYSTRLYLWAKQYLVVGHKRVSVATLRKILALEDVKDNSGRVVQDAPLELWANVKQRALDPALKEINKQSDIQLEIEFVGRGTFRKVLSLSFRITAGKNARGKGRV